MQSLVKKPKWGYFPSEGHPEVVTSFEGTKAAPEFLQAIAYEVYVKNVTFGLLHQWLTDMGMTISKNTLRNCTLPGWPPALPAPSLPTSSTKRLSALCATGERRRRRRIWRKA